MSADGETSAHSSPSNLQSAAVSSESINSQTPAGSPTSEFIPSSTANSNTAESVTDVPTVVTVVATASSSGLNLLSTLSESSLWDNLESSASSGITPSTFSAANMNPNNFTDSETGYSADSTVSSEASLSNQNTGQMSEGSSSPAISVVFTGAYQSSGITAAAETIGSSSSTSQQSVVASDEPQNDVSSSQPAAGTSTSELLVATTESGITAGSVASFTSSDEATGASIPGTAISGPIPSNGSLSVMTTLVASNQTTTTTTASTTTTTTGNRKVIIHFRK